MFLKILKSIFTSFLYILINSFITVGLKQDMGPRLATIFGAIFTILIFIYFHLDTLKIELKRFKKDFKFNYLFITLLTTIGAILIHAIIVNITGYEGSNQSELLLFFKENKIAFLISTIVVLPFLEELTFRYTYRKIDNKIIALVLSSIIFVFAHLANLKDLYFVLPYLVATAGIGYTYFKSDNVYISYIAHALNNIINVLLLFI